MTSVRPCSKFNLEKIEKVEKGSIRSPKLTRRLKLMERKDQWSEKRGTTPTIFFSFIIYSTTKNQVNVMDKSFENPKSCARMYNRKFGIPRKLPQTGRLTGRNVSTVQSFEKNGKTLNILHCGKDVTEKKKVHNEPQSLTEKIKRRSETKWQSQEGYRPARAVGTRTSCFIGNDTPNSMGSSRAVFDVRGLQAENQANYTVL